MYVYGSALLVLFSRIKTESLLDLQMLLNRGRYLQLVSQQNGGALLSGPLIQ